MSYLDVADKARKLTRTILSEAQLERLIDTVNHLEKVDDLTSIGAVLRRPA